jgi:hypothetical protein
MTMKAPHKIKSLGETEIPRIQQNIDNAYSTRVESLYKNVSGTSTTYLFQSIETGEHAFSGNGSATVVRSFGFKEKKGTILYAQAHARSINFVAAVTDVTQTGITVECAPRQYLQTSASVTNGSASLVTINFSSITTSQIVVGYFVLGAE